MKKNAVAVLSLLVGLATSATGAAGADRVAEWNARAGEAARAVCISPGGPPPPEARLYAMMHLAIHDALNAIDRRSRPYAFDAQARKGAIRPSSTRSRTDGPRVGAWLSGRRPRPPYSP